MKDAARAGADGPSVRGSGARARGLGARREPRAVTRHRLQEQTPRARLGRADRPADGRRRRRAADGPADRPVRLDPGRRAVEDVHGSGARPGSASRSTFGNKIPGKLQFPDPGDLAPPGPEAAPTRRRWRCSRSRIRCRSCARSRRRRRSSSTGTAKGSSTPPQPGCSTPKRLVLYSAPFEHDPAKLRKLAPDATLVVTDSNRRRGTRWSAMTNNYGYTEQAGEKALVPTRSTSDSSRSRARPTRRAP